MNLSAPFIKRPVMTTFLMLAIILAGWMAYRVLPVSDLPTIEYPRITVMTRYVGASPEVILDLVTIPMEKELALVKGVKEMSSSSNDGVSFITLTFDIHKNMDEAVKDLLAALHRAEMQLPDNIDAKPTYFRQERNQEPIMSILLTSSEISAAELRQYANSFILPRLNRIEGIAQAQVFGPNRAIWVRVNPEVLAARKIGFNQVIETIRAHTGRDALGTIQTGTKTLNLELQLSIKQAKDLENVHLLHSPLRLKDVADITEESEMDEEFHFVTAKGVVPTVVINIQKASDANTVAISKEVKTLIGQLQKELPSTIQLNLWFDKAQWIEQSISDVQCSLAFAFLLVILVIYFSLGRITDALIPSVALPLSLVGTFAVMYLLDFSIDLLSLLALTLSVGFVVDDAIVVLENIVRHQERGESTREASLKGSKEICFTILSMTLSLIAVFIPLLFMPGMNGKLFREFSITLASAILVSGFISLTLTPMLCAEFLKHARRKHKESRLAAFYGKTLKYCFTYPKTILLIAALCMGATVPLFMRLPINLIPEEDRGLLMSACSLPAGSSPAEVKKYQANLEAIIQKNPYVESFFNCNFPGGLFFMIRLQPRAERPAQSLIIAELQQAFDRYPGLQSYIQAYQLININFDWGSSGQFKYELYGISADEVDHAAATIAGAMKTYGEFSNVDSSVHNGFPKLAIHINEEQAHLYGFSKQQIQELLHHAFSQSEIGNLQKGTHQEKIFLKLQPEYANRVSSLSQLALATEDEQVVPLKAFSHWEEILGVAAFERRDQLPLATIYFSLTEAVSPNIGVKKFEELASQMLPKNVNGELAGAAKTISGAMTETILLLLAAALVMYIVLGILYESFIHPLTILSSLPFAGLGGVLTLFAFSEPISIFSAVGFLLLLGIVKKNGIMMIDYALVAQLHGKSASDAIFEGCLVRFRPIMMTTIAAIMGAIPIAIGIGEGAEMRRGLGLVIVGGLLFSQLLTLYVTPIIFLTLEKLRQK